MPVLVAVSNETIDKNANDPRTQRSFKGIKLKALKESVASHLCMITGGPCKYDGETMKKAHLDAKITEAEFDAFVDNFRQALDDQHVATREKNDLLKLVAPMKRDILTTE